MKIREIGLNNFRNFEDYRLNFLDNKGTPKNFIAIIGDNGVGKTAILEGITKGFVPVIKSISSKSVKDCDLNDLDILHNEKSSQIFVNIDLDNEEYNWVYKKDRKVSRALPENTKSIKNIKSKYRNLLEEESVPLILYYGINRMLQKVPVRTQTRDFPIEESLNNCFNNTNDFKSFYEWFKAQEDIELRERREDESYINTKLNSVRTAIENMIPGYTNLRIKLEPKRMVFDDGNKNEIRVEQLSGGYKSILSLVSDIAIRLTLANPNSKKPLEEEAVILIDELDLHLHPKWQKRVVHDLKRTFKNCQFIVTTHSPFIIQSLDKDELFNIENMDKDISGSYAGWSIDEIQEYEMGVEQKTIEYSKLLKEFNSAIDDEDINSAKRLYNKIDKMIYPNNTIKKLLELDMIGIEDD